MQTVDRQFKVTLTAQDLASGVIQQAGRNLDRFARQSMEWAAKSGVGAPGQSAMVLAAQQAAADDRAFERFIQDQRGGGLRGGLMSLKHQFGKSSTLGLGLKTLAGGGAIMGLSLASNEFEKLAEAIRDAVAAGSGLADTLGKVVTHLPVIGGIVKGIGALRDAMSGEAKRELVRKAFEEDQAAINSIRSGIRGGVEAYNISRIANPRERQLAEAQLAYRKEMDAISQRKNAAPVSIYWAQQEAMEKLVQVQKDLYKENQKELEQKRLARVEDDRNAYSDEREQTLRFNQVLERQRRADFDAMSRRMADRHRAASDYQRSVSSAAAGLRVSLSDNPELADIEQQYQDDLASGDAVRASFADVRRSAAMENYRFGRASRGAGSGMTVRGVSISGRYRGYAEGAEGQGVSDLVALQKQHLENIKPIRAAVEKMVQTIERLKTQEGLPLGLIGVQ